MGEWGYEKELGCGAGGTAWGGPFGERPSEHPGNLASELPWPTEPISFFGVCQRYTFASAARPTAVSLRSAVRDAAGTVLDSGAGQSAKRG